LQVRAFVQNAAVFVFIIDACCSTFGWEARRQQLPHLSPPPPPPHCFRIPQAAAAARIAGKPDVINAAEMGNIELVKDHVVADAGCVLKADSRYVCQLLPRAAAAHAAAFNFSNFCYQWLDRLDILLI
jgi:hypothetical protein